MSILDRFSGLNVGPVSSAAEGDVAAQTECVSAPVLAEEERHDSLLTPSPCEGFTHLDVPVWHLSTDGRLDWCNLAYAGLYNLPVEQVVSRQKIMSMQNGSRQHLIVNGSRHLFEARLTHLSGGAMLGIAQDVTREEELVAEHKRAQTATKELMEQLSTSVVVFGGDQRVEFFNTAFSRLWQVEEQWLNTAPKMGELLEKLRENRRLPEQVDFRRYKQFWIDMFTNLIDPYEEMMHLPNGEALRVLVIPNPAGGLIFTCEDVTSRLELETSYNTLVAVQKETLDNLNEGVAVFGGDGRLRLWNPAFAKLWGLNPEDLSENVHVTRLIDRVQSCFVPEEWEQARNILLAQVLNGQEVSGRLALADGRLIRYGTDMLPDGGVLLSHFDVTDSVRVENALRDKNSALEAAERLKLDFLANVSYQLRTPLNAIMGFTEILHQEYFGPLNEKQKQYTQGTKDASERLLYLIDDILDLSTIEAGQLRLDYDRVQLADVLNDLKDLTQEWARKEGIEVSVDADGPSLGVIEADPRRLKQIVLNLIRNSIAFTPPGGRISIGASLDPDARHVHILVSDTGRGIPSEDQERVFAPFERGGEPEGADGRKGGGAGLGLTLVKNITQMHGGTVTISSASGQGTSVTITLPVVASPAQTGSLQ